MFFLEKKALTFLRRVKYNGFVNETPFIKMDRVLISGFMKPIS